VDLFIDRRKVGAIMQRMGKGPRGGTGVGTGKPGRPQTTGYKRGIKAAFWMVDAPRYTVRFPVRQIAEAQFKAGNYRYDTRLRARRFPLVDEERGVVVAAGFIDHAGAIDSYKLTDGTVVKSPVRRPHSFYLFEAFKMKDNAIEQIEANFITVPYNMPSPWDDWNR
jgi:hypothetical protein